jgi:hypothetical protein
MNAPSIDVKDILAYVPPSESSSGDDPVNEFGLVFGTNLFVGREPAQPDETVSIFDVVGWPPYLTFNKDEVYERPAVQVRVRSRSYVTGWNLLERIVRRLHGITQETWNGTLYSVVRCSRAPMLLDWDENARVRLIASFEIQRRSA